MKKIEAADPIAHSADLITGNVKQLKTLFPELITEGPDGVSVNVDVLKALVGDRTAADADEKYGLNWHGKRRARQMALSPSTGTLRPRPEDSVDWETTRNLMIEGDNLEVLKLLQKSYSNKIKLIYIDPPYNTGKDFVYPDSFQDNIRNYLELTGQVESGKKISTNTEASGRFHTDWLNMMLPRLSLARNLLKRDGAIFVSCDEGEQARLRLMMDEVFGAENFVADMVWAAGRKNDSRLISVSHEYIVCYVRDIDYLTELKTEWRQRKKGLEEIYSQHAKLVRQYADDYDAMTAGMKAWYRGLSDSHPAKAHQHYANVDARGVYFPDNISWPGGGGPKYEVLHPKTRRPVKIPSRGWMTSDPKKLEDWIAEDRVHFGDDESKVPCIKSYLKDRELQTPYSVFYQDGRAASKRLRALMGGDCFDFPKDEGVLQEIIEMTTSEDDVVLDFFAGSGTTGHAVMTQNAIDGGRRRYILVQIPQPLDSAKPEQAAAASYCLELGKTPALTELTKERLRRAAHAIKSDSPAWSGDAGFRAYRLATSNIRAWNSTPLDLPSALFAQQEKIVPDRTEADILTEILLKLGLDLCVPVEPRVIRGLTAYSVGAGTLIACLVPNIEEDEIEVLAQGIVSWLKVLDPATETTCVFRDSAFPNDVAKTNMTSILQQAGIKYVRSL